MASTSDVVPTQAQTQRTTARTHTHAHTRTLRTRCVEGEKMGREVRSSHHHQHRASSVQHKRRESTRPFKSPCSYTCSPRSPTKLPCPKLLLSPRRGVLPISLTPRDMRTRKGPPSSTALPGPKITLGPPRARENPSSPPGTQAQEGPPVRPVQGPQKLTSVAYSHSLSSCHRAHADSQFPTTTSMHTVKGLACTSDM